MRYGDSGFWSVLGPKMSRLIKEGSINILVGTAKKPSDLPYQRTHPSLPNSQKWWNNEDSRIDIGNREIRTKKVWNYQIVTGLSILYAYNCRITPFLGHNGNNKDPEKGFPPGYNKYCTKAWKRISEVLQPQPLTWVLEPQARTVQYTRATINIIPHRDQRNKSTKNMIPHYQKKVATNVTLLNATYQILDWVLEKKERCWCSRMRSLEKLAKMQGYAEACLDLDVHNYFTPPAPYMKKDLRLAAASTIHRSSNLTRLMCSISGILRGWHLQTHKGEHASIHWPLNNDLFSFRQSAFLNTTTSSFNWLSPLNNNSSTLHHVLYNLWRKSKLRATLPSPKQTLHLLRFNPLFSIRERRQPSLLLAHLLQFHRR